MVLSISEETLIKKAMDLGAAKMFFDSDEFYSKNKSIKAGLFLRRHIENSFGSMLNTSPGINKKALELEIIHCTDVSDQAKAVVEQLKNLSKTDLQETAILLPDENFLIHLLGVLSIEEFEPNITMGLSGSNTVFASWIQLKLEEGIDPSTTEKLKNHPFQNLIIKRKEYPKSRLKGSFETPARSSQFVEQS